MIDALFGDIEYEFGWVGQCTWPFFGNVVTTRLIIPCEETDEIEPVQRAAFVAFERDKAAMCKIAEDAILAHYRENLPELRERFGSQFADQWAPEITGAEELSRLVRPTEVIIQQPFTVPPERVVGLLFDCTWDTILGLAVKFVNDRLNAVGPQDIVL